ncbi:MAG: urea ABC transporter [Rhodobacteraceae bacterium]|nr:MAG: urea ABC transporter [Paracoccaceae bacterium]
MSLTRRSMLKSSAALGAGALAGGMPLIAEAADEIVVAQIHDMSGGLDIYGAPMVETFNLAADEINAAGGVNGKPLRIVTYDPQSNMQLYSQLAQQAALRDRAAVVHGGITSASREVIRPVLRRFNTLYFYNTLYEGGVCDRNTFCLGTTPAQTVEKLVPYVLNRFGPKVYTIAADYNYGQITAAWVKKYVEDNGGEVVATDFFPLDVTDFGATISRIQQAQPDMVMSILVGGAHVSFYRQWFAAGMKDAIPIASTTFGGGNEHIILTDDEARGIIYACGYFMELDTPASKDFVARFAAKYGPNHSYLSEIPTVTYEGLHIWAKAANMAGTTERMAVIEALESDFEFDGPTGPSKIDAATHHAYRSAFIAECTGKGFQFIESHELQPPADTQAVCDLIANPDENQHFQISL